MQHTAWKGFITGVWDKAIDVRDFIQRNYNPYVGDDSFLVGPTERTQQLWQEVLRLYEEEKAKGGVLDADTDVATAVSSHGPGYIIKDLEQIVGLQTDKPLKRAMFPYGGLRTAKMALKEYGFDMNPQLEDFFHKHRKTHNDGVFDVYTPEMRAARSAHIITGLPDAYSRGRIIGDYRRIALYGVDRLIEEKEKEFSITMGDMTATLIRDREEIRDQIRSLKELKEMAASYGFDISQPAKDTKEAIQWLYFGYLGAIKEQNGAAMSIGRNTVFLDIYAERDLQEGRYTETEIQEMVDHFIMKLRMVRFARIIEYNNLFTGDPVWTTESIGGMGSDGRPLVSKMAFRYLHTLTNLGPAPEPNLTVLWSPRLPDGFKRFCAKLSIETSSIQYENDELMRPNSGDDYAIACCVSPMRIGKEMQFFGARCNLAKCLLYAINGGIDEKLKKQVGPKYRPITSEYLDFDDVMERFDDMMEWLAGVYVNALNIIHYMHDKYAYEKLEMALHDRKVTRWFATGIAGLSVVADSLSAIKYAKVKPIRDENGIAVDFEITGEFPKYGNDDDRVDDLAATVVSTFMNKIRKHPTYRESVPTMSLLTITSNVVYGNATGSTPDGRKQGTPFAPGANPMHGRDSHGAVSSMASVAKMPWRDCSEGISNTFSIIPDALGKNGETMVRMSDLDIKLDLDAVLQSDMPTGLPVNKENLACREPNVSISEKEDK
ncbi:formate C-acetyltransferase [Veillonella sp.]|uniref:formate C-acetyltransferase n=1 Tax=Veillonella sp. TaxID=1926307 RepID=UPI0025FA714E|nr:formate C-acetyltransferase [Veillonella sp.]